MWRDLLGSSQREQEEDELGRLLASHLSQEQSQELQEAYKNLYWSGLISMQRPEDERREMQPVAVEVIQEINDLEDEEREEAAPWQPSFDPQKLQNERELNDLEDFRLADDRLMELGQLATRLRSDFLDRAQLALGRIQNPPVESSRLRTRKGVKLSKPEQKLFGCS